MAEIYDAADLAAAINTNEGTLLSYVEANPGETLAEIKTANSGINEYVLEKILNLWVGLGAMVIRQGITATVYYSAGDWGAAIWAQKGNARNWINETGTFSGYTNAEKTEAEMVTDFASEAITITIEVATGLFQMLAKEGSAELKT